MMIRFIYLEHGASVYCSRLRSTISIILGEMSNFGMACVEGWSPLLYVAMYVLNG